MKKTDAPTPSSVVTGSMASTHSPVSRMKIVITAQVGGNKLHQQAASASCINRLHQQAASTRVGGPSKRARPQQACAAPASVRGTSKRARHQQAASPGAEFAPPIDALAGPQ